MYLFLILSLLFIFLFSGIDVNAWFQILGHILQKDLPEASEGKEPSGQPLSLEDRKVWPWWKVSSIIFHFISIYLIF